MTFPSHSDLKNAPSSLSFSSAARRGNSSNRSCVMDDTPVHTSDFSSDLLPRIERKPLPLHGEERLSIARRHRKNRFDGGSRGGRVRIVVEYGGFAGNFPEAGIVVQKDGTVSGVRFQYRNAESFIFRRIHEHLRITVKRSHLDVVGRVEIRDFPGDADIAKALDFVFAESRTRAKHLEIWMAV